MCLHLLAKGVRKAYKWPLGDRSKFAFFFLVIPNCFVVVVVFKDAIK